MVCNSVRGQREREKILVNDELFFFLNVVMPRD